MNRSWSRAKVFLVFSLLPLLWMGTGCDKRPLIERLLSKDAAVQSKAIKKLAKLSPEKKIELIPPLINALGNNDNDTVSSAAKALVVIGGEAVPALTGSLKSEDPFVRLVSLDSLGKIGAPSAPATPQILEMLMDKHPLVREEAVRTLDKLGPGGGDIVPGLAKALKDSSKYVRVSAKEALEKIGTDKAKEAIKKIPPEKKPPARG